MLVASTSVVGFNCTTPSPTLGEPRHRRLARHLVAVRRRARCAAGGGGRQTSTRTPSAGPWHSSQSRLEAVPCARRPW